MAKTKKPSKKSAKEHNLTVKARRILATRFGDPEMKERAIKAERKAKRKVFEEINKRYFGDKDTKPERKAGNKDADIVAKGLRVSKAALDSKKRLEYLDALAKGERVSKAALESKKRLEEYDKNKSKKSKIPASSWGKGAKYTPGSRKEESRLERLKQVRKDPAKAPRSWHDRMEEAERSKITSSKESQAIKPRKSLKRRLAEKKIESERRKQATESKYEQKFEKLIGNQKRQRISKRSPAYDKHLGQLDSLRRSYSRAQKFDKIKSAISVGAEIGKHILLKTWDVSKAGFKLGATGINRASAQVRHAVEQKRNADTVNKIKEIQRRQVSQPQTNQSGGAQLRQRPIQSPLPTENNKKFKGINKPSASSNAPKSPFQTGYNFSSLVKKTNKV